MPARSGTMPAPGGQVASAQLPWGWLGYATQTGTQTGITTQVDLTGLSIPVTVGANRLIKITAWAMLTSSVANDAARLLIMEGATQLSLCDVYVDVAGNVCNATEMVILAPTAGAHTYKLQGSRGTGTGNISLLGNSGGFNYPAFILVEDIGPST